MTAAQAIASANLRAARDLVDSLLAAGLQHAVICPGSRSGPLAVALDERRELHIFVVTDERSAGFFAVGLARATGLPPLLLCTSGTAAANFVPAVVEAFFSQLPLIVATADRPPELRHFRASQTIRQSRLFADHTRAAMDLAVPSGEGPPSAYFRAVAAHAFATATALPRGPVHLNIPFREPLLPLPLPLRGSSEGTAVARRHGPRFHNAESRLAAGQVEKLTAAMARTARGLLVLGPSADSQDSAATLAELARALGWPVLADPLSGLRAAHFDRLALVDAYDVLLRSPDFCRNARPELVVRFGGLPTSKALLRALETWDCTQIVFVTPGEWADPAWTATEIVVCDPTRAAKDIVDALGSETVSSAEEWQVHWCAASSRVREALHGSLDRQPAFFEARAVRDLARLLPEHTLFVIGNSMPVRDVDTFCGRFAAGVRLMANRGANGIDGVVSTALGAAAILGNRAVLLLGDLSFLHDVGALRLALHLKIPLLIVVINNDGGGIFHLLPWAELGATFERCFATPHGLSVSQIGVPVGVEVVEASSEGTLRSAVQSWLTQSRVMIIEVKDQRETAVPLRASAIAEALVAAEYATETST